MQNGRVGGLGRKKLLVPRHPGGGGGRKESWVGLQSLSLTPVTSSSDQAPPELDTSGIIFCLNHSTHVCVYKSAPGLLLSDYKEIFMGITYKIMAFTKCCTTLNMTSLERY